MTRTDKRATKTLATSLRNEDWASTAEPSIHSVGLGQPLVQPPRWKTVYDQLYMELPRYAYGSDFYSISAVCRRYDVSSITAIRALNELAGRGLIEKIPGKGNVVRQASQPAAVRLVLLTPDVQRYLNHWPIAQRVINGITSVARQQGVDFDLVNAQHLPLLFSQARQGMGLLLYGNTADASLWEYLRTGQYPFLLIDPFTHFQDRHHVRVDRVAAGYMAVNHLLGLGHRRIGWLTGHLRKPNFRDRLRGGRRALHQAGLKLDASLIRQTGLYDQPQVEEDQAAVRSLLSQPKPPTAIIVGDDTRGIHVLEACRELGVDVPRQLSVISYPNNSEASLTTPGLTAIDPGYEQAGSKAMELLVKWLRNPQKPPAHQTLISPQLVLRESTGPANH